MALWILIALLGLLKLPLVALMIWIPFRSDTALNAPDAPQDDGGSKTLPQPPRDPHPRGPLPHLPRRGPHGSAPPPAPRRVRALDARPRQPSRAE
jgi:hypothetical protein